MAPSKPFVSEISADKWQGNSVHSEAFNTIDEGIEAIRRLDGKTHTEVDFVGSKRVLTVSGGNDGRYIAFISINTDQEFYNLVNPQSKGNKEIDVVAGGQRGLYPEKQVINRDEAIEAARYFYQTGEKNPSLTWEN